MNTQACSITHLWRLWRGGLSCSWSLVCKPILPAELRILPGGVSWWPTGLSLLCSRLCIAGLL